MFFFFLDDTGVYSKTKEQRWEHLRALFSILAANGLTLNLEKCVFPVAELDFFDHRISTAGIAPLQENVQVIMSYLLPLTARHYNGS
jgi:hypothetical protein